MKNVYSMGIIGLAVGFLIDILNAKKGGTDHDKISTDDNRQSGDNRNSQQSSSNKVNSEGVTDTTKSDKPEGKEDE